ncbi:hypothetical protein BO71DRAFT_97266 [Aspergillus ellipticus CBS 707.79]|uniref:Uncharacterized protein n=1 Tax=Aspergillus ellipticus CBS 707.79 TaxID=1448320 RepID=A0A319CXC0_9EURO|nr:hypothetical protein BO71DRAFT_97266 [Aspergillus ellipticus CBS 707.79]
MATNPPQLTEQNLALHTLLMESSTATEPVPTWVESLIAEERIRLVLAEHNIPLSSPDNLDIDADIKHITEAFATLGHKDHPLSSSKLCEHAHSTTADHATYRETPLERFLTPGHGDPSYVAKASLADAGIQYGSMEDSERRRMIGEKNAEDAKTTRRKARHRAWMEDLRIE